MLNDAGRVKAVFERPQRYLDKRECDIRIRTETVQAFTAGQTFPRVLDIGCGDGSISLPLLSQQTRITLLDLSSTMLSIARSHIPSELAENVCIRNQDFMTASLDASSFELILCMGVLAYVESLDDFIKKLCDVLTPEGTVILEFTDSRHFVGRFVRFVNRLREVATPPQYHANLLSFADVDRLCNRQGLRMVSSFRYDMLPLPNLRGLRRVLDSSALYRFIRLVFGTCANNRNAALGNEYICLLTRGPQFAQA